MGSFLFSVAAFIIYVEKNISSESKWYCRSRNAGCYVIAYLPFARGFFRDRILASQFGAGTQLDIYYAAFRVPDLLFNLIVLGALSAGFIPIFSGLVKNFTDPKKEDNQEAWLLAANVINLLSLFLLFFSLVGIIFCSTISSFDYSWFFTLIPRRRQHL